MYSLTHSKLLPVSLWSFVQFRFKLLKQWVSCCLPLGDVFKGCWILPLEHCSVLFGFHVPSYESKSSASKDSLERRVDTCQGELTLFSRNLSINAQIFFKVKVSSQILDSIYSQNLKIITSYSGRQNIKLSDFI